MEDRLIERLGDANVAHDTRLLGDFAEIYCKGNHETRQKRPLSSAGVQAGAYGKKAPVLCDECAALLVYAENRRAFCPQDRPGAPKPFCSHCETQCYKPDMRAFMRAVMRYSGPRSVLRGHALDSVKHAIEGRKAKKARERAAGTNEDKAL